MPPLARLQEAITDILSTIDVRYVAIGIGFLLLVVLLFYLIYRLLQPTHRGEEFISLLSNIDRATVLMHTNPDPDAMASAVGIAFLGELADTEMDVLYPGQIRHQENRAFRTVLELELTPISTADDLPDDPVILVDHNVPRDLAGSETITPTAIIDHHPNGDSTGEFVDIRPDYGAAASIIAEYCEDVGIEATNEDDTVSDDAPILPTPIATGLLYGILSDTSQLTRGCSPGEFRACSYLYPAVDQDMLDRITHPEVDAEILDIRARAITNREIRGPFAISEVGMVSNVDAIPQAADELLKLEGITAVIVFGEKEDTLYLSGRSRDDRVHIGNILHKIIEDIPMSTAGGHARMGGGQVSVTHLEGLRPESGLTRDEFIDELFTGLSEY